MSENAFEAAVAAVRDGANALDEAKKLYDELTDDERLGLLDGDLPFWQGLAEMMQRGYNTVPIVHGAVARLGIPGLRFSDGPRGVVMGHSTAFPVSMARGATYDVALEERIGQAIGAEVRAQDGNFFAGVCINLPRHPAWGRAQETYGEDPLLLGELGAALTRGVRTHVMACAKHFALNSMENARFQVDVTADDRTLHEVYLPHFRRVVEEGVDGIMTSYNSVNGEWAGQNPQLMTEILRDQWGFEGVTVSDFILGLRDAATSLEAGLDVEEPFQQQRAQHLRDDLESGRAAWAWVERSGVRSIATQLRFAARRSAEAPSPEVVASDAHRALAREAAGRAMVLLRNEPVGGAPVLPLNASAIARVALIGRLADLPNTGDHGSSDVRAPHVVTALEGLRAALPGVRIDTVLDDELDFAVVPAFEGTIGLKSRLLVRDREMLISGPKRGLTALAPVRLGQLKPLKIVVPGPDNIRRRNLETYFQSHGVEIEAVLEMDAMIATLEFVARSDWVTVLPSVISVNDIGRGEMTVNPLVEPELHAEFVVIQPTRRVLSTQARLFLERFEREVAHIHAVWDRAIAGPTARTAKRA